jgi:hypothetical protein
MKICVDFDGTIVDHRFPDIGKAVPGAFRYLKEFQKRGAKLILFTMRSEQTLADAVGFCLDNGLEFWGINSDPTQRKWTTSPKAYGELYIDDAAYGCPLHPSPRMGGRPQVDWSIVGPGVLDLIDAKNATKRARLVTE